MIRLWRSIIGIVWGAIVGAIALSYIGDFFNGEATFVPVIVLGCPIFFGFLAGVMENWWYDFFQIIYFPIISILYAVVILLIIALVALVFNNPVHILWILAILGLFVPSTASVIIIVLKK